ncbi:S9 family peptidase [Nocardia sp. NRRL S-836]|uniref:alpha/beta hydrolase family protein n=1 Tax=Nocardia sp. NRRL S-836 TaxID=1519492 RepID=UPI0006B01B14|nr:hypothetical protein [Nocardia sp. NRRL S-836]KOV81973.1 hypothetical protein ADL03_26665 [Nocardia sp. NRRL S-836]
MRRAVALLLPALLIAVVPAQPASAAPEPPGFSVAGGVIRWISPRPLPVSDAGVEFWEGDRFLGSAAESADLRTFTLRAPSHHPAKLEVRSSGRRIDVEEPPAATLGVPELPAVQPEAAVDPGKPGSYATTRGEYRLDPVRLPGYAQPIEMQAVVVAPQGAHGKRPLVLFLHGRHYTCYSKTAPDVMTLNWPCPEGLTPVPSHRGYLRSQELLASQGYVTVSISANGINAQDAQTADAGAQARSSLVRHHLAKWADWSAHRDSAPDPVRTAPPADMAKVLLVGHSRGGEGVNRAATDSLTPPPGDTGFSGRVRWSIRGDVLIGPTIFGHNPAPDVPSVTLLPGCDGDVSDLQGQLFVDQTRGVSRDVALHSALYVVGANHNFYNSEWTPGQSEAPATDDFFNPGTDPVCAPGTPTRLTADQQQVQGATYTAAAAHLFLSRDERVLPLLDGSGVRAPSADPARVLAHAVGGARKPLVVPSATTTASGSARVCLEVSTDPATACGPRSPHFVGLRGVGTQPERLAVALRWSTPGQPGVIALPAPVALAGSRSLALRLAVPANTPATSFEVFVTDPSGRRSLGSVSLTGLPGSNRTSALWAQEVRVPLPTTLGRVSALELVPTSASGEAWLIDAHGWTAGLPPVPPSTLGRADAELLSVAEGDSGTRTYTLAVTATGTGTRTLRVFFTEGTGTTITSRLVTLHPGEHRTEVPISATGNTRWGTDLLRPVAVQAIHNVVAGAAIGGLLLRNDDPVPTITATPLAANVTEGMPLRWRLTLSEPADAAVVLAGLPVPPAGATELSTTDVDADWFVTNSGEPVLPERPLSQTQLGVFVFFAAGQTTTEVAVPTVTDGVAEGEEQVRLRFEGLQPVELARFEVVGSVQDAA